MDFEDKVVLVTGASRGIGRATAEQFAAAGARVAVHYNSDRSSAEDILHALEGANHSLYQANIGEADQVQRLIAQVVNEMGKLDILVNNAGIYQKHVLTEIDYQRWQQAWSRTLAVNLTGPANLTYFAALQMIKQGGGRIVNISSRGAFRGEPEAPAYGASKAGLNAMSQSLAVALAPHNIFVYVVAPGWVDTDMAADFLQSPEGEQIRAQSPLNRVALPEEVANTILFLASEGSVFLTGSIVDVNGASYLRT